MKNEKKNKKTDPKQNFISFHFSQSFSEKKQQHKNK